MPPARQWKREEPTPSPAWIANAIAGMFDAWGGTVGQGPDNIDAVLMGEQTEVSRTTGYGYKAGQALAQALRGVSQRAVVPYSPPDELGYFIAGTAQTAMGATANAASAIVSSATGGYVNVGDTGGWEDSIAAALGF